MFRNRPAAVSRSSGAVGLVLVVWLQASLALGGERKEIGKKIIFSGEGGEGLPQQPPDEKYFSRPFELLERGNSFSGVVEPLAAPFPGSHPSAPRNTRLWELFEKKLEQKKNWVYGRPEDWGRQPTLEEMFGLRESQTNAGGRKSRNGLAAFFEDREQDHKPSSRRNEKALGDLNTIESEGNSRLGTEYDARHRINDGSWTAGAFEPNRIVVAGFSVSDGTFNPTPNQGRLSDFAGVSRDAFFGRERQQEARSNDFRRLLVSPSGINPLARGFDPINLRVDMTRQELNPITPLGLNHGLSGSSASSLDPLRALAGPPGRGSLTGIEDFSTKVLGPSSLSPAVGAPVEPRYSQPSPVVLEFPKRKF